MINEQRFAGVQVNFGIPALMIISTLVGASLMVGLFQLDVLPGPFAPAQQPLAHSDLPGLFEEFKCPCCEDNIGECTCGLAAERRDLLTERVTLGDSRRDTYELMLLRDGPSAFFDPAAAAQAETWLTSKLPAARPELAFDVSEIDMGTISMADGPASVRFPLHNEGRSTLVISSLETSCMCTTAALEIDGQTGPTFGMAHDENQPTGWSAELAPGEAATLIVTFDPNAHGPEAVGQFMREVTVLSDDPLQPQAKVRVTVNVEK